LIFQDLSYAKFGAGSDMSIYHDGTNSRIHNGTGALIIRTTGSFLVQDDDGDEVLIDADVNGAVALYCDNTKQFETAYGGVVVTGIHSVGTGATISSTGNAAFAGVCTASAFKGDGSNLTGIAAGGSGEFNTSISGATQYDVTTSMATALTANASASHRTIVHSIHICNISAAEASISGEIQSSFSIAHNIPVPAGSAVELLKQPKVLGPSETIELQSDTASALEATIIIEYKEDTDFWDAQVDLTSAATLTDIYVSTTNPSVVQSILLANDDGTNDVKARVAWTDGSNNIQSYLCYDMVIPAESTVELCEKPKYLAADYKLRGYANQADRLEITASGKQITS
jgi:phage gp36-like protein